MSDYKVKENEINKRKTHPAYGMLSFSRRSGGKQSLFGSSIEHKDVIAMTLRHGEVTRGLSSDWYHGTEVIAEVEMSYAQFAEAITSMNMGSGVPVTVIFTEKDGRVPECDFISKRQQFVDEFSEKRKKAMKNSQDLINKVTELFQKKSLNKADREEILKELYSLNINLGCNLDFVAKQFNEQMDKTVMEAKGEIESFYQNKINSIASAALVEHRDELRLLDNPVEVE